MSAQLALAIIQALVGDFPELLQGIKDIVAAIEGQPSQPAQPPLTVAADTAALAAELDAKANS